MTVERQRLQPVNTFRTLSEEPEDDRRRSRIAAEAFKQDILNDGRATPPPYFTMHEKSTLFIKEDASKLKSENVEKKSGICRSNNIMIVLILLLWLCLLLLIIMTAVIFRLNGKISNLCTTSSCASQSALMTANMNLSAEPCEDFYEYACGNWDRVNPAQPGVGKFSNFYMNSEQVNKRLYNLLSTVTNEDVLNDRRSEAVSKARSFFRACENMATPRGVAALHEQIGKIGGWTLTPNVASTVIDLDDTKLLSRIIRLAEFGSQPLFSTYVTLNDFNSSNYMYAMSQGKAMFLRSKLINEDAETKAAFVSYATSILTVLGAEKNDVLNSSIEQIWNIEVELEKLRNSGEERKNISNKKLKNRSNFIFSLEDFAKILSNQAFSNIISPETTLTYLMKEGAVLMKAKLSGNMLIDIENIQYIVNVVKTFFSNAQIGNFRLSNYLTFRYVSGVIGLFGNHFEKARSIMQQTVIGDSILPPSWKSCVGKTNEYFRYVTASLYVQKYVESSTKSVTESIMKANIESLTNLVNSALWIDEETKKVAIAKINHLSYQIAYPDWILDVDKVDEFYSTITVNQTDFFASVNSYAQYVRRQNLAKYGTRPNFSEFSSPPLGSNANYNLNKNHIVILTAILQRPFFSSAYQTAFNMGGLGVIIGHELSHGFDSSGSQFDENGNLRLWWTTKTHEQFQNAKKCFTDQYSAYTFHGIKGNSKYNLDENMADNAGIRIAYNAFKARSSQLQSDNQYIVGANLSPQQIFFLAFAQIWCGTYTNVYAKRVMESDAHSPYPIRVLGTLSNMPEFSEAFKCKSGSKYNPTKRCTLW